MAKRRKKRASHRRKTRTRTITKYRTRHVGGRRRRSGRRRHHGGGGALMPSRDEMYNMGTAAVYGFIEGKAKKDDSFFLNKLVQKSPIPQIGFAGNVALAARLVNGFVFRHPLLRRFGNVTAEIAFYQMGRQGGLFSSVAPFTVQGEDDDIAGEIDDSTMGALAADADAHELEGDFDVEGDFEDGLGEDPDALEVMAGEEE